MEYLLLVGVAFWSTLVFIGVRRTFESGESPICEKARELDRAVPHLLLVFGLAAPALAVVLVAIEIGRIHRMAGQIGGFASLGFLLAMAGSASLAAHQALRSEVVPRSGETNPR